MTGEATHAQQLVTGAMERADRDSSLSKDAMGRAIVNAVLGEYRKYRSADDIASELRYIIDTLDEDDFVITRGC
jgi:hypothetical protein